MRVTAGFVVFWCTAAFVASDGDDFNAIFSSYSPGVIQDVRHVSEFPVTTEDGYFLNEILQPPTSNQLTSVFPMPYEVQALLERSTSFSIRLLNSSWSGLPTTNVIHKGEQLYVQVSASPGPGQQLYVQSCHASPSPNPSDKAEVAFIINKGCVASKTSPVKFVRRQSDQISLVLGTSGLKSPEVHLHCRVSLSYLGLTSTTKFCNYNKLQSRWVDLSGQAAVCQCCGRSCRSLFDREDPFALTVVVSTGPLVIKDQQSETLTTPPSLSDYSTAKAKPLSDKRLIMAGASFSGNPLQNMINTSPWPVSPGFGGGVMVISQGLGGALSMWLPGLMDLQLNPASEMGIGYPESPVAVELSLQGDDPFKAQNLEEEEFKKWQMEQNLKSQQMVEMDDGKAHFEVVDPYDGAMWNLENVAQLYKAQGEPFMTENVQMEQPKLNEPFQMSDLPPLDLSSFPGTSPSPVKVSNSVEDEDVFRQAEMTFERGEDDTLSMPLHYSKLSLKQAADGSSSLQYEEQKSSRKKKDVKIETSHKDKIETVSGIKDLVLLLLDGLRGLWH